jgi:hypothetical protein
MARDTSAYHQKIEQEERAPAHHLVGYLLERFKPRTVADFGCSTGIYLEPWPSRVTVQGFESDPAAVKRRIHSCVTQWDLVKKKPPAHFDLGICLEVLEHIPAKSAARAIRNVCAATTSWLLFSAAVPGQGGQGYVNCQDKPYWIKLLEAEGWIVDYVETVNLLAHARSGAHMGWFTQNAMMLRPYGSRQA